MSWLDFFQTTHTLKHTFGRGINASIALNEEELFINSSESFTKKEIIDAYEYFLRSLINYADDTSNENVLLKREDGVLYFTLYQGSAKVEGKITHESLYAEAVIVEKSNANVALKRYLLERNYQFTYAYYFSGDKYLKLKLSFDNITMSPQKIFFPLREIALNADHDKEYIKSQFSDIQLEDISHIKELDKDEVRIKYNYFKKWLKELDENQLLLPSSDALSMQAYLYLGLLLRIDYLLVPKYKIAHKLTKKVLEYYIQENASMELRIEELRLYIEKLKTVSFEEFSQNLYNANYTFNPMDKSSTEDVLTFISESLVKVRWYKNNRYYQIIPSIYKYIALYALFNYGLNPVLRELFHLFVEIQFSCFFKELGYKTLYNEESETFTKKSIIARVEEIMNNYSNRYKNLEAFGNLLNYNSLNDFSNSFYLQLQELDFEED